MLAKSIKLCWLCSCFLH